MADVQHRVADLENEIKVLKNEIKAILLDIREQYLNAENPFNAGKKDDENSGPTINIGMQTSSDGVATVGTPTKSAEPVPDNSTINSASPAMLSAKSDSPSDMNAVPIKTTSSDIPELDNNEESNVMIKEQSRNKDSRELPTLEDSMEQDEIEFDTEALNIKKYGKNTYSPKSGTGEGFQSVLKRRSGKDILNKKFGQEPAHHSSRGSSENINLITVAGLSRWVDESTEKIGRERTEIMVEASHVVGYLPADLKDLLIKIVRLSQVGEPKKGKITTSDYLSVIAQLDSLLGFSSESEAALLSILTDSKETNHG